MSADVDRIVQNAVTKFQGLSPVAVREIVETTVETVRADLLVKFQEFQEGIVTIIPLSPATRKAKKNLTANLEKARVAKAKAAPKNGEKKPRKPLSDKARKNLAANLKKARAAKAKKAKKTAKDDAEQIKKTSKANEARSAAMKTRWAQKKKDAKKASKKKSAKKK